VGRIYKPLLIRWLSSTRTYVYKGIQLLVPSEVFHPGFFLGTKLLLKYLSRQPLQNRLFLELGAGSGLISLYMSKKGAKVTATDINPQVIEYLERNSAYNGIPIEIIHSDLFCLIPVQRFDIIAINPPYYKRKPLNFAEYAWYCGEKGEYFTGLFSGLAHYAHESTAIWMVLSDGCDIEMVGRLAKQHGWALHCMYSKKNLLEKNFIYKLEQMPSAAHAIKPRLALPGKEKPGRRV
jgi:release factor glutamine methyltransferase